MPTLPHTPADRLAIKTTTRSPLKDEPGWATHTPFPNFGKAEYFWSGYLTGGRVFCPTDRPRNLRCESATVPAGQMPDKRISHCGHEPCSQRRETSRGCF